MLFDERRKLAGLDERANLAVAAPVGVMMLVMMHLRAVVVVVRVLVFVVMMTVLAVLMLVRVRVGFMRVLVSVGVLMFVPVLVAAAVVVLVLVLLVGVRGAFVDAEFHALDVLPLLALEVHVKIAERELREFPFEGGRLHAKIDERANSHVAADA